MTLAGHRVRYAPPNGGEPGPWVRVLEARDKGGRWSLLVAVTAEDGTTRLASWGVVGSVLELHPGDVVARASATALVSRPEQGESADRRSEAPT